jgi:hypothetical protein
VPGILENEEAYSRHHFAIAQFSVFLLRVDNKKNVFLQQPPVPISFS